MKIALYEDGAATDLRVEEIAGYLGQKLGCEVVLGGDLWRDISPEEVAAWASRIAGIKIPAINKEPAERPEPLPGEVEYEGRRLRGKTRSFGVAYEGFRLQRVLGQRVPFAERQPDTVSIVFTNRLFATWDAGNGKFHLRTGIYGLPSLISTTGLIEAPAKSKDYYLLKQQYEQFGKDLMGLKDRFRGRFLDYGDSRLTEVSKGYAMQAVFYSLTGEPFCDDRACRLYNAHWQDELVFAQLGSEREYCPRHEKILEEARHRLQ